MTPSRDDALKLLTLDLISPARPGHRLEQHQIDALTDADWTEILRMARQHRIGPMMRWQLQHAHPHIRVPQRVADALTTQHKNWTTRAMAMQRELLRVHGILEAAGIPHVFLKGAYLAYCVYPHPALRPLRDLDILIPPERLMDARAALIAGGLTTLRRFEVMPESMKESSQHLPPLFAGTVMVELHRRALHLDHDHQPGQDLADDPTFWSCCVSGTISGTPITAPSAQDQLIHIVVHAVYDHALSNGPLLLSDLGFLAAQAPIDWPALRRRAEQMGYARGFDLALALLREYWGTDTATASRSTPPAPGASDAPVTLHAADHAEPPKPIKELALRLMLRSGGAGNDAAVLRDLREARSSLARLRILLSAACPPRAVLSYAFGVPEDSPSIWLHYLAWWWRHISRRLKPLLKGKTPYVLATGSEPITQLQAWLSPDRPAPPSPFRAR
jgi:hypothetical protein